MKGFFVHRQSPWWGVLVLLAMLSSCDYRYSRHALHPEPVFDDQYYAALLAATDRNINRNPNEPANHYSKAVLLASLYQPTKALASVRQAIALDNTKAEYYVLAAQLLEQQDSLTTAYSAAKTAESFGYQFPDLYQLISRLYFKAGNYRDAIEYNSRCVAIAPQAEGYRLEAARLHLAVGDTLQARQALNAAYALAPNSSEVQSAMVDYYEQTARYDTALLYLHRQLATRPNNMALVVRQGTLLASAGMADSALVTLNRALVRNPASLPLANQLMLLHYQAYTYDSALYYANRMLGTDSTLTGPLLIKARIFDKRYRYASARQVYQQLLAAHPGYEVAQQELNKLNRKIAYLQQRRAQQQQPQPEQ